MKTVTDITFIEKRGLGFWQKLQVKGYCKIDGKEVFFKHHPVSECCLDIYEAQSMKWISTFPTNLIVPEFQQ